MLLLEQQFARILNIFIFQFAPFVLVPSSFPRKEFEKAVALQPIINRLMHNVAHDEEFITTTLAETIKVDEFTANLFNIYRKVLAHGFTQVRFRQPVGYSLEFIGPLHPRSQSNRHSINRPAIAIAAVKAQKSAVVANLA